ncbi:sulfotransferase family protein [Agrobacterium tumefaciens]|uniref:Sulfotransferase 2 n=1 Tax=Agrobacterium tumefaciens TaxID=358 RepID=A0A1S6WDR2_AGRTU|nr:sulfotransferase 2 [Agrobacterium radiobacter]OMP71412.1 hypothetical protein BV900_15145 [Agrobacterium tumefaciens]
MKTLHVIVGLPRSGSTLLSAVLGQNPRFSAGMTSALAGIIRSARISMGPESEFSITIDDARRERVLRAIFEAYHDDGQAADVVFDTSRSWAANIPLLARLYPNVKVIACVRNPAWVLDSIERLVRDNPLGLSRIFRSGAELATVYSRANALLEPDRMIGLAWNSLLEGFYGAEAHRMLLIDYAVLCKRPAETMARLYDFIDEPLFNHDFEKISAPATPFDDFIGLPGLHRVGGSLEWRPRASILPPDLFERFSSMAFWHDSSSTKATFITEPLAA